MKNKLENKIFLFLGLNKFTIVALNSTDELVYKEEILTKQREERATPEGRVKARSIDKKCYYKRMQDPVKKEAKLKYQREWYQRKLEQMSKEDEREFRNERNRGARENYRKRSH